jgi:hypothetical protein
MFASGVVIISSHFFDVVFVHSSNIYLRINVITCMQIVK